MKIEKGIPLPKVHLGREGKYPFKDMKVGDSIFVDTNAAVQSAYQHSRRYPGVRFTVRKNGKGFRIWRIK